MAKIIDELDTQSVWIAEALRHSGYNVDFVPASLWEIDRFLEENSRNGKAIGGKLLSKDLGARIFSLGCYVGEVLRRTLGGEWHGDDADPQAEVNVELHLPDGSICWPVQRVMKRLMNGAEDSITSYGTAFGSDIGPAPESPPTPLKKPWWRGR